MYIDSKLEEIDLEVFHFELPQKSTQQIHTKQVVIDRPEVSVRSGIFYGGGFYLIESVLDLKRGLTDIYSLKGEFVHLSFTYRGNPSLSQKKGKPSEVNQGMVQVSYGEDFLGKFFMEKGSSIHYYSIILSREYFLEVMENEQWAQRRPFFQSVKAKEEKGFGRAVYFPVNGHVLAIIVELQAICSGNFSKENKQFYLHLKFRELFLNVYLCQADPMMQSESSVLERINKAKAILVSSHADPPTIKELSKQVLLNELKLKQEFKKAFGITIRGFVIRNRMEMAIGFLKEGKQVGEIAELLGYSNVSYFINTFRKYFGQTPKQALKSNSIHQLKLLLEKGISTSPTSHHNQTDIK